MLVGHWCVFFIFFRHVIPYQLGMALRVGEVIELSSNSSVARELLLATLGT